MFGERLAAAREQGIAAVVAVGWQELRQMPAAVLRVHLYQWQKRRQRIGMLLAETERQPLFGTSSVADDGRFSRRHLFLELAPFLFTAIPILLLTYRPPSRPPATWPDPIEAAVVWAGMLPLLILLWGLAQGMPRWAYPHGGLVIGYTLWTLAEQQLAWLAGMLLLMAVSLAVMALFVHQHERPLPTFFQRLGASAALDWTRLSFAVFGAAPLLILAAFDNAFTNQSTPYLGLSLLLMCLTSLLYSRSQRQERQLAVLLGGTTALLVPALLDHLYWQSGWDDVGWLFALWVWMVGLLLMPMIAVPVKWTAQILSLQKPDDSE